MKKNLEIRNITTEIRSIEEESRKVSGLAIPVSTRSELLYGEFYETIDPAALEGIINNFDVKLYVNHDASQGTYARSKYGKGSLRLFISLGSKVVRRSLTFCTPRLALLKRSAAVVSKVL